MNAQQMKAEIAKANFQNVFKISSLSDENFDTFCVSFAFCNSELQHMFHVKPLREDGTQVPEGYYFVSESKARAFISEYHDYHTLAWWQAIKKNHHQMFACLVNLFMVRNVVDDGVENVTCQSHKKQEEESHEN